MVPETSADPVAEEKVTNTRIRISLDIDLEIHDAYAAQAAEMNAASKNGHVSAEHLMAMQLQRFAKVPPSERILVVDSSSRDRLEHILSGGALQSGDDLYQKVRRLADIDIGQVRVEFTPSQLAQLKRYATRNEMTAEEAIRRTVRSMEEQFFEFISD